jgi:hypothetical protein
VKKFILGLVLICYPLSCGDDYMTIERNVIDAENKVPIYFYADAEQAEGTNSWRPVFTYYIYSMEEGEYEAYFHAYCVQGDSVIWSGVQPITIQGGKKVWGEYVSDANFTPDNISNVTPMAYVSVRYEE